MASPQETLTQLNSARDIVLRDHTLYPQVVPGIVQVVAPGAALELRRWGADFLAETFASQVVTADEKQQMAPVVLDDLKGYLNRKEIMGEEEDTSVVKSAVQCAASIYPFIFAHTASNPSDSETWRNVAAVKSSILRRMDNAAPGVRICCIKFVASVVQTQTPGLISDPRRPELNEISLALVPRDHPVIPPQNLEAEASGLLDRLLGVLEENLTDPLIITATLNALATLVQRRASVSSKILMTVCNFNPLALASGSMSGRDKVAVRSMTRTTISFLLNFLKRNSNNALAGRIGQQVERLKHQLTEAFSEHHSLKRSSPDEPIDGLDDAKRQRLDAEATNGTTILQQGQPRYPPPPSGPMSLAQLWTLTNNQQAATFDVTRLPHATIVQLVPALFQAVDPQKLNETINVIRSRWLNAEKQIPGSALDAATAVVGEEDDDDYDPTAEFGGQSDQVTNRLDKRPLDAIANDIAIGPFSLPPPPPLSEREKDEYSRTAVTRVFSTLTDLDRNAKSKGKQSQVDHGFNRLVAASTGGHDRESWITLVTRLATRTSFQLDDGGDADENGSRAVATKAQALKLSTGIRLSLERYIMEAFRSRIDVAIIWLSEEWYSDRLAQDYKQTDDKRKQDDLPNYWHWTLRLLDAMTPYLDVKDGRILIRLLSEIPALSRAVFERLKKIAEDPERIQICTNTLLYLIMFRPPARKQAIDCAEEMWNENSDAKSAAKKILIRWRPSVLQQENGVEVKAKSNA